MQITSVSFAVFAGLLLAVYYRVPCRHQWKVLLAGGALFCLMNSPATLVLLMLISMCGYLSARKMEQLDQKSLDKETKGKKRGLLLLCLAFHLGILMRFKYAISRTEDMLLPMGLSYFTFQSMGYVLDVYRNRETAQKNFLRYVLFLSFFPQLIQGPISKHSQLAPLLSKYHSYDRKQVSFGLQRMLWGYFKKLVVADRIAPAVAELTSPQYTGIGFFVLTLFYAVRIYGDFTGGIDIVLGYSQALGIMLPENFIRPFFSRNIAQYWRRWHITLGSWMKEYIFYPVSICRPVLRLSKRIRKRIGRVGKRLPVYLATVVTWLATGIWHGITPNYLLWAMLNCFVILSSEALSDWYKEFHDRFGWNGKPWYGFIETVRTFLLMNLIRVSDLFPDVGEYFRRVGSLFSGAWTQTDFWMHLELQISDYVILGLGTGCMLTVSILQEQRGSIREMLWNRPGLRYGLMAALFLCVLLFGCYGIGYDASSFVYNRF